jgi:hypothetical protein
MSLLEEYKNLEKVRQEEAKAADAFYKSVNTPGDRTFDHDASAVRARLDAMKAERAQPNHKV